MAPILGGITGSPEGVPVAVQQVSSKFSCLLSVFVETMLRASYSHLKIDLIPGKLDESVETRVQITLDVYRWETTFMDPILGRIK